MMNKGKAVVEEDQPAGVDQSAREARLYPPGFTPLYIPTQGTYTPHPAYATPPQVGTTQPYTAAQTSQTRPIANAGESAADPIVVQKFDDSNSF